MGPPLRARGHDLTMTAARDARNRGNHRSGVRGGASE
jgi:hypothetical protein